MIKTFFRSIISSLRMDFIFISAFTLFLILLGGFGISVVWIGAIGIVIATSVLIFLHRFAGKTKSPPLFFPFLIFLGISAMSLLTSYNPYATFSFLLVYLSGFLFFIIAFKLPAVFAKALEKGIVLSGLVFLVYFIANKYGRTPIVHSLSIPYFSALSLNHSHIGDFWIATAILAVSKLIKNPKKPIYILIAIISVYAFVFSMSRASYVAMGAALYLLAEKNKIFQKHKKLSALGLAVFIAVFLYASSQKSLLSSRPYFVQALKSVPDNPIGVGLGNFHHISRNPLYNPSEELVFSFFTHNIVLEMAVAVGMFSLVFIYWLLRALHLSWKTFVKKGNIFALIFIAYTVNFMFDYTYFIPSMLWLWFVSLGLSLKDA